MVSRVVTVNDILDRHVSLDLVPGQVVSFLTQDLGFPIPSPHWYRASDHDRQHVPRRQDRCRALTTLTRPYGTDNPGNRSSEATLGPSSCPEPRNHPPKDQQ
jgi:hypothetical protein